MTGEQEEYIKSEMNIYAQFMGVRTRQLADAINQGVDPLQLVVQEHQVIMESAMTREQLSSCLATLVLLIASGEMKVD